MNTAVSNHSTTGPYLIGLMVIKGAWQRGFEYTRFVGEDAHKSVKEPFPEFGFDFLGLVLIKFAWMTDDWTDTVLEQN